MATGWWTDGIAQVDSCPRATLVCVPMVDLILETYVVAAPAVVSALVHDPARWRAWWPDLALTVYEDRGLAGLRFTVTGVLAGSSELWLEPVRDGVLVHYYLRADITRRGSHTEPVTGSPRRLRRRAERVRRRHAVAVRLRLTAVKDELEAGRPVGLPRTTPPDRHGE